MEINKQNKQQFIKENQMKFFWQQKMKEISKFILIVVLCLVPYFGLLILFPNLTLSSDSKTPFDILFSRIVVTVLIDIFCYGMYSGIKGWIEDNLQKAKRRAEELWSKTKKCKQKK